MATIPMKYEALINVIGGQDKDWKIYRAKISDIYDPSSPKFQSPKLDIYMKLLRKGRLFPPIILDERNWVVDGTHRLHAYRRLDRKTIPAIKPVSLGTGKVVSDSVYKNIEFYTMDGAPVCFICKEEMAFHPYGSNPAPMPEAFPDGLPYGPIYYCRKDKIIVNKRKFLLWRLVS